MTRKRSKNKIPPEKTTVEYTSYTGGDNVETLYPEQK